MFKIYFRNNIVKIYFVLDKIKLIIMKIKFFISNVSFKQNNKLPTKV